MPSLHLEVGEATARHPGTTVGNLIDSIAGRRVKPRPDGPRCVGICTSWASACNQLDGAELSGKADSRWHSCTLVIDPHRRQMS